MNGFEATYSKLYPNVQDRYYRDDKLRVISKYAEGEPWFRYSNCNIYSVNTFFTFTESEPFNIFKQSNDDGVYRVSSGEENRLDIISFNIYGTPIYWWLLAKASFIQNPFDVPVGTLVRVPSLPKILRRDFYEY